MNKWQVSLEAYLKKPFLFIYSDKAEGWDGTDGIVMAVGSGGVDEAQGREGWQRVAIVIHISSI